MLNWIKQLNSGYVVAVFLGLWLGAVGVSNAFIQNDLNGNGMEYDRSENYDSPKNDHSESSTNYSFSLERMSRKAALKEIAERANLTLAYCSGLFQKPSLVSVRGSELNYERTIQKVLKDSGLGFKITGSRHLVVFEKEKANVAGKVLDKTTRMPLQGARVMLVDQNKDNGKGSIIERATFVNSNGQYSIKDVDPGTYKLVIAYFGYNKAFEHVKVDRGTTVGNFQIEEKKD